VGDFFNLKAAALDSQLKDFAQAILLIHQNPRSPYGESSREFD
jgi:hypothetical protein